MTVYRELLWHVYEGCNVSKCASMGRNMNEGFEMNEDFKMSEELVAPWMCMSKYQTCDTHPVAAPT